MADYENNEEEEEETFGTEVQERAMFLLDLTTADLLEQTSAAAFETRLEAAMKIVLAFIKGRLVGGGKDVVGVAFCGDGSGSTDGCCALALGADRQPHPCGPDGLPALSEARDDGPLA